MFANCMSDPVIEVARKFGFKLHDRLMPPHLSANFCKSPQPLAINSKLFATSNQASSKAAI